MLRAPEQVALSKLTVRAEPGFRAKIQAGNDPSGPFENVSGEQDVEEITTFDIDTKDTPYRYYVVWLRLPRSRAARRTSTR